MLLIFFFSYQISWLKNCSCYALVQNTLVTPNFGFLIWFSMFISMRKLLLFILLLACWNLQALCPLSHDSVPSVSVRWHGSFWLCLSKDFKYSVCAFRCPINIYKESLKVFRNQQLLYFLHKWLKTHLFYYVLRYFIVMSEKQIYIANISSSNWDKYV